MTKAKKLVALMLAFLMIFSSVSVLASAMSDTVDSGVTLGITTKFFKKVDGVLTETTKVNPKETDTVKARVYLDTDYYSGDSTLLFFYDKDFFTHNYAAAGQVALAINPAATNGVTGYFVTNANLQSQVNAGYISADQLNEYGVFAVNLATNGTTVKHDGSDWLFEFELEVLDTAAGEGDLFTVEELYQSTTRTKALGDVPKGVAGGASEDTWSMWVWDATFNFESNPISTISSVTFDANGGTFAGGAETFGPIEGTISETIAADALPANPSYEGYTFLGWVDAEIANPTQDDIVAAPSVYPDDDLVLNAYWIKNVNITFADTGDTTIDPITNVTPNTAFKEIANPTKAGYTFVGWDVRGGELPDVYPTADTTYTAIWAVNVKIEFEMNGADAVDTLEGYEGKETEAHEKVEDPADPSDDPVKAGHYFVGWLVDGVFTKELPTVFPGKDIVAEAIFDTYTYYVTYIVKNEKTGETQTYFLQAEYDAEIGFPRVVVPEGYAMDSQWYTDEACTVPFEEGTKMGTAPITLYTKINTVPYKVYYMLEDGDDTADAYATFDVVYGEEIPVPANPTKGGYNFGGWTPYVGGIFDKEEDIYYYATWVEKVGNVEYLANDGTDAVVEVYDIPYGFDLEIPADPAREGYTFLGWNTDPNATSALAIEGTKMPEIANDGDVIKYYAVWQINQYTVTFDSNQGSAVEDKTQAYKSEVTAPAEPVRPGYKFLGWTDANGDAVAFPFSMPAHDVALTASWKQEEYVIRYVDTGDKTITDKIVVMGQTIEVPTGLTKDGQGLYFTGWDVTPPTAIGDMGNDGQVFEYTAQWAAESYTIIYNDTGDTAYENKVVKKGDTIEIPSALTKDGQGLYFTGWDVIPPTAIGDMGNNGDTFTYTAQWEKESYVLKFANTGDTVIADKNVTFGDTIEATAAPEWAGHVFAGWDVTPPTAIGDLGDNGEVITYTADWTVETYIFHFTNTGDNTVADATVTFGQDFTAPTGLTKYGYNFAGFDPAVPTKIEDMGADKAEFTYAAQWTPKTIEVYFNANGGTFGADTEIPVESAFDGTINLPAAPTKAGYGFVGWSTDPNATTGSMSLGNLTTETPATYYAIWSADSVNYVVEFWYMDVDGQGYTRDDSKTLTLPGVVDTLATYAAAATETGFELNVDESTLEGTVPATGTLTLSAYYDRLKFDLTYEGNDSVQVYYGAEIPAAVVTPEKEGNYFVKWQNDLTKMPASDLDIAAEWALEEYTIVFADTGDVSYENQKVNMGDTIEVPADLAKAGQGLYFTGWDKTPLTTANDMGNHGDVITYTAQWANETYVLTFTNVFNNTVDDLTVEYGTDANLPAGLVREGYSFLGWKATIDGVEQNLENPWYIEDLGEKGDVITLEARWNIQRFTVTFDADGGTFTGTNPVTQAYGTNVAEPAAPSKTGYDFSHWINTKDGSTVAFPFVVPAENSTLKAVYTPKTYVLKFADTGDNAIADMPVTFGDTVTAPTGLTKAGQGLYFTGWDKEIPATIGDMGATGTVFTYTAQWTKESYTLTFADTGDTTVADMPVTYGDTITVPSGLTKDGQGVYFTGIAPELTATIGDLGDNGATVTYTAQWANESYTLTFTNLFGNTVADMPVTYGDTITVPSGLTRYGYEFAGWAPELNAAIGDLGANGATVSYAAQWTAKTINVTFDGNEGTIDGAATKVVPTTFDGAITAPAAVRDGYSFIGWSTDANATTGTTNLGTLTTETPATYYAIWSADAKTYKVEFYEMNVDGNGYTKLDKTETLNGTVDKETAEYAPTVPAGFALNAELSVLKGVVPAEGELVLKVYFDRNKYTLTYAGAESFEVYFGTAAADMPATAIVPTKEGHVFANWQALPATMPATAYTVAADWTAETYTVIFADTNDAGDSITENVTFGGKLTIPTGLTKTGHVFAGWDKTPSANVGDLGENKATVTYTAQWTKETYTLTFTNLYDNTVADMPVTYGDTIVVPAGLTRYGFDFAGWAPELTETIGDLGANKATVSYAAQWTEKTINVTFDGNEGTIDGAATKDVPTTFNGAIVAPTGLARDGYSFAGWSTDKNAEIGTYNLGTLTTETPATYYAIWTANGAEYKVEFWYMDLDGVNYTKADTDVTLSGVVDKEVSYAPSAKEGFALNNEKSLLTGTVPATGELVLKVYYDRQKFDLVYLNATGTAHDTFPVFFGTAAADMPVPADAPEKVGNYFNGWQALPATMPAKETKIAPIFAVESYTLTFAETGKTVIDDIPVKFGDIIDEVADPEKEGYKFIGWNPEVPTEIGDLGNNGDTITYTAQWQLEKYNLVFADTNDAGDAITMNVTFGDTITVPSGLTKTGYVFAGWNVEPSANIGDLGEDGDTITYTAQWTKETYTLIFADTNDAGDSITKVVTFGDTIEIPAGLTKTGYFFTGWDVTPPTKIEDMGADKATFTYNAQWTVETYVFHFTNTGDTTVEDVTVTFGQDFTAPAGLTKYGYDFAGFDPAVPTKIEDMGKDKAEFTYAAQWTPKTIEVYFNANGGTFGADTEIPVESAFDGTINLPAAPTKAGYGFVGWSTDANATTGSMSLGNLTTETPATYYAIWSADSVNYVVEFWYMDVDGQGYTRDDSKTLTLPGVVDTVATYAAAATETGFELNVEESTLEGTVPATGTLVLAAYYDRVQYTLSYEGNEAVQVYYGAEIPAAVVTPEKEGNYFVKWQNNLTEMPASDLSIAAEWALEEYTITFTDLYGNAVENIVAKYGDTITVPAGLTREGYVFAGWKNAAGDALTTPVTDLGNNGDTVAYAAQWNLDKFTITIKLDGGNIDGNTDDIVITQDYGTDVAAPAKPVKEGYAFVDWNVTIPSTMPAEDMTITAIWKTESYTVVFADTNDAGESITLPVAFGDTITVPSGLTKTGYVFAGWDNEPSANIGDLGADGATVTYTAQWTKETYTLSFADTNDAGDAITMNVTFGETITVPADLTKTGHVFAGWDVTPPTTIGDLGANGATVTYTAQWTKETYTLKFANTGDTVIADKVVTFGDTIEAVADPTWAGYKFSGWDVTPPTTIGDLGENGAVITYNAKWDNDTFKVTWIDESGSTTVDVVFGDTIVVPTAAAKEGYYFVKWTPDVPATMPAENLEFTALYEVSVYTVNFYINGEYFTGYGAEFGDEIRTEGIGYTVPLGSEFDGWYTNPECTEKFVSGTVGTQATNLYAKVTDGTYAANFYLDEAKTELYYTVNVQFDKEIKIPEEYKKPTKEGYTFAGWDPIVGIMDAEGKDFVAIWNEDDTIVVTYYVDGEVYESFDNQTFGGEYDIPADPYKKGHKFEGWAVKGTTDIVDIKALTVAAEDAKFEAIFTTTAFAVNYFVYEESEHGPAGTPAPGYIVYADAEGNAITGTYSLGDAIAHPVAPEIEYYTFAGWFDADGNEWTEGAEMPANEVNLYAKYDRVAVKLVAKDGSTTVVERGSDDEEFSDYYLTGFTGGSRERLTKSKLSSTYVAIEGDGDFDIEFVEGYTRGGTGAVVVVTDNVTGAEVERFYIVIYGDINGDGQVNGVDSSLLEYEVLNVEWSGRRNKILHLMKAGDLNADGKITGVDSSVLESVVMGATINQETGEVE